MPSVFPKLVEDASTYNAFAKTLYREMSECIHGNIPNSVPLPNTISFGEETFRLWHAKASTLRHVVLFVFTMRYFHELDQSQVGKIEPILLGRLGHLEAVRLAVEGGKA